MESQILLSPKLKIGRADEHINSLKVTLAAFLKTGFYRLHVEKDPNDGSNKLRFEVTDSMPRDVPLIIGDAVHNLRAALDLTVYEMISLAGATPTKWLRFPFRDTRDELIAVLNGAEINIAGPWLIDLIVNKIKPYKGGDTLLCALHDLDILDKHRLLIPTLSITKLAGVNAMSGGIVFKSISFTVSQNGRINFLSSGADIEITDYGQPSFNILFDKGQILEGYPLFPTLHRLSQLVSDIVQAIEEGYWANKKSTK